MNCMNMSNLFAFLLVGLPLVTLALLIVALFISHTISIIKALKS